MLLNPLRRAGILVALGGLLTALLPLRAGESSPAALVEDGHWKRARAVLEPAVRSNPADPQSAYLLSKVLVVFGELEAALRLAEQAAAADPRNADYRWQVAVVCGELADRKGGLGAYGLARRFKREAEAAAALDPRHIESRFGLMEFHFRAPWVVGGSDSQARKLLAEIKRIDPARGAMAQVTANRLEKKSDSPVPLYLQAIEADPSYFAPVIALANFYLNDKPPKPDLAEKYARMALKLKPQRTSPYSALASSLLLQRRWQELDAVLAQAEAAVPDSFTPYYFTARLALQENLDLPRAERYLKKYLSIVPEPGTPTHADAHFLLGSVYEKLGRRSDAIPKLEEALRLNPKHEDARKELKRLKG
jgi:tetratricopeptide (TPR) repeat protein